MLRALDTFAGRVIALSAFLGVAVMGHKFDGAGGLHRRRDALLSEVCAGGLLPQREDVQRGRKSGN